MLLLTLICSFVCLICSSLGCITKHFNNVCSLGKQLILFSLSAVACELAHGNTRAGHTREWRSRENESPSKTAKPPKRLRVTACACIQCIAFLLYGFYHPNSPFYSLNSQTNGWRKKTPETWGSFDNLFSSDASGNHFQVIANLLFLFINGVPVEGCYLVYCLNKLSWHNRDKKLPQILITCTAPVQPWSRPWERGWRGFSKST